MVKVGINGFGRIGRMVYRVAMNNPNVDIVAVNDLTDPKTLAHLLKYDSVHGKLTNDISSSDNAITIDGKEVKVFAERDPANLPWGDLGVDIVVDSTGIFTNSEKCQPHLDAGAKKVIISAPAKGDVDITIVKGVNEHDYDNEKHHVISNASCTTNCLAPIVKVLHDNFGIEKGMMTTVHAYTQDQRLQDAPHSDMRRARAAAVSMVPTTTGAAKAVTKVIPNLAGKLDGMAIRVPISDGSITDFNCILKKNVTVEEVNKLIKDAANHHLKDIIEYTEESLVSVDIIGNPHSSIFDSQLTLVEDGNLLKVLAWYDNEWGYSNRVVDVIEIVASKL